MLSISIFYILLLLLLFLGSLFFGYVWKTFGFLPPQNLLCLSLLHLLGHLGLVVSEDFCLLLVGWSTVHDIVAVDLTGFELGVRGS